MKLFDPPKFLVFCLNIVYQHKSFHIQGKQDTESYSRQHGELKIQINLGLAIIFYAEKKKRPWTSRQLRYMFFVCKIHIMCLWANIYIYICL